MALRNIQKQVRENGTLMFVLRRLAPFAFMNPKAWDGLLQATSLFVSENAILHGEGARTRDALERLHRPIRSIKAALHDLRLAAYKRFATDSCMAMVEMIESKTEFEEYVDGQFQNLYKEVMLLRERGHVGMM